MVFSETLEITVRFSGRPSLHAHRVMGLFGSASMMVTAAPFSASSVARMSADVDFPAPPLGVAKTIEGMSVFPVAWVGIARRDERRRVISKLPVADQVVNGLRCGNGLPSGG